MGINRKTEALVDALKRYQAENRITTKYRGVYGRGLEEADFAVFDLPADYVYVPGIIDDRPECRAKPVLIATYREDGSIIIEETEDAKKYLQRAQTA